MGIYKYDVDDLGDTATGLRTLKADFEAASRARDGVDGALGYGSLRGAVGDFVDNWEHNRERQTEAIGRAAESLGKIVDNYVQGDTSAAAELRSGG